jgi:prophage regulatory protein
MSITREQTAAKKEEHTKRILRMKETMFRTGLSRGGIYARLGRDEFPASSGLGGRAVGWLESDIDAWISERIAESKESAKL